MKVKILSIIDNKTFKAEATSYKAHKKYGKYLTSHKKYLVHYEGDKKLNIGEEVTISETRPISKNKRWILK
ncbi:MAG: Ribosomal protein [Rickettsiaceae bacterium]|jgi:small subunit ribosomal protein S17|nr:Ribosomal protein [Rickettsiaceae bacterium]